MEERIDFEDEAEDAGGEEEAANCDECEAGVSSGFGRLLMPAETGGGVQWDLSHRERRQGKEASLSRAPLTQWPTALRCPRLAGPSEEQ